MTLIQEIERHLILNGLHTHNGNCVLVAKDLRMPKSTLHDRIITYGIDKKSIDRPNDIVMRAIQMLFNIKEEVI